VLGLLLAGAYHSSLTAMSGQTLGQRALGIRVVSVETGGVPTLGQAALRWALTAIPHGLAASVPVPQSLTQKKEEALAAMRAVAPDIERLEQQHRGSRQALNEALMALYEERKVKPMAACAPTLLQVLPGLLTSCLIYAPVLRRPLHRGIHDRLSKTVVVQDAA
jgi:uncharacterized RDD family membrane protein YckC